METSFGGWFFAMSVPLPPLRLDRLQPHRQRAVVTPMFRANWVAPATMTASHLPWSPTELTKSFLMTFILALSTPPDCLKSKTFPDHREGPYSHQVNPMITSALALM